MAILTNRHQHIPFYLYILVVSPLKVVLIVVCWTMLAAPVVAEQAEYVLKAAFIEKFTRFIEWPDSSAMTNSEKPFEFCVIGADPFGDSLEQLAQLTKIKQKPVHIQRLPFPSNVTSCDLVFISSQLVGKVSNVVQQTHAKPILTVGDSRGFSQAGVIINFYVESDKLGFEVNLMAAQEANFAISSRLLKLARIKNQDGTE